MEQKIYQLVTTAHKAAAAAGVPDWAFNLAKMGVKVGAGIAFVMLVAVVLIYVERKTWAYMQDRLGPMRVGPKGILQPVADGLKLFLKEDIIPANADRMLFRMAPIIVLVPAIMAYLIIPFGKGLIIKDLNIGILYILAISSVEVLGIIGAGWASNNKYSLLGGMRAAGQIISYEVPVIISISAVVLLTGSLSMNTIVAEQSGGMWHWFAFSGPFPQFIAAILYLICSLAELNRTPFDLPEAESELVSGFCTEYSGMRYAFFFLAEWMNVFLLSCVACVLFFGGWHAPLPALEFGGMIGSFLWFFAKCWLLMFVVIWIRATYPRFRVDQLMEFAWKVLIPVSIVNLVVTAAAIVIRG
jgi:NADH-quinone oxidoreductase subunit H